ncbi:MAG: hypothetical protein NZ528_15045 [Caldilineales bacterium]|nr:hypothetical protein [Caldilineales bacterium]MDW8319046.1 hypothetical protein [Anaerolineae bacterium]
MHSRSRSNLGFLVGIIVLLASSAGIGLLITLMAADAGRNASVAQWTSPTPPTTPSAEATPTEGSQARATQGSPSDPGRSAPHSDVGSSGERAPLRPTPPPLRTPVPLSSSNTVTLPPASPVLQPTAALSNSPTSSPTSAQPPAPSPSPKPTPIAAEPSPPAGPLRQLVSAIGTAVAPRSAPPPRSFSPPELTGPPEGSPQSGVVSFTWASTAPLPEDVAYEVVWWVEGQDPASARGVAPPTRDTHLSINLDVMYQANLFGAGNVYWAVILVRPDPYTRLTLPTAGQGRRLVYQPPPPPPTPTPEPPPEQPKP